MKHNSRPKVGLKVCQRGVQQNSSDWLRNPVNRFRGSWAIWEQFRICLYELIVQI